MKEEWEQGLAKNKSSPFLKKVKSKKKKIKKKKLN